jgi:hypothetical protein
MPRDNCRLDPLPVFRELGNEFPRSPDDPSDDLRFPCSLDNSSSSILISSANEIAVIRAAERGPVPLGLSHSRP